MKKILILGGTQFIGRNLVEQLQGMDVFDLTLFNRQETQADLFPKIKRIKGDRETHDINQITKVNWDFVIDLSCYYPNSLSNTLDCLNDNLEKYILISTCSVYDNESSQAPLKDEEAKILMCNNSQRTSRDNETYGNRKAECERILQNSGLNYVILRPSLVYGKHDHTDRLYYWLYQVKFNEILLLPDKGERQCSLTYVHDLVNTIVALLSNNVKNNIYNVISTPQTSIKQIVECAMELLNTKNKFINAKPEFLKKNKVSEWFDMPLWLDGDFFTNSNQKHDKAFELEQTSLQRSIEETIAYYDDLGWMDSKYGMTEKERMGLLEKI